MFKAIKNLFCLLQILSQCKISISKDGFYIQYKKVLILDVRGKDVSLTVEGISRRNAKYHLYDCEESFNPDEARLRDFEQNLDIVRQQFEEYICAKVD